MNKTTEINGLSRCNRLSMSDSPLFLSRDANFGAEHDVPGVIAFMRAMSRSGSRTRGAMLLPAFDEEGEGPLMRLATGSLLSGLSTTPAYRCMISQQSSRLTSNTIPSVHVASSYLSSQSCLLGSTERLSNSTYNRLQNNQAPCSMVIVVVCTHSVKLSAEIANAVKEEEGQASRVFENVEDMMGVLQGLNLVELPDAVVLSYALAASGALEAVRSRFSALELPVLLVAEPQDKRAVRALLHSGANDFMMTPLEVFEINARVRMQAMLKRSAAIAIEARANLELLQNILPPSIIRKIKAEEPRIAQTHEQVTILFSDIRNFTVLASQWPTDTIIDMLNDMFSAFDELTEKHGVYKVETIGDAYMVVCGHDDTADHTARVLSMARDMLSAVESMAPINGHKMQIRIGVHSGPAHSGVVGSVRPRYCFFGDTVNTASRMESTSFPMCVQLSESAYNNLSEDAEFECECLGTRDIKGKGMMTTYLLKAGLYEEALLEACHNHLTPPPLSTPRTTNPSLPVSNTTSLELQHQHTLERKLTPDHSHETSHQDTIVTLPDQPATSSTRTVKQHLGALLRNTKSERSGKSEPRNKQVDMLTYFDDVARQMESASTGSLLRTKELGRSNSKRSLLRTWSLLASQRLARMHTTSNLAHSANQNIPIAHSAPGSSLCQPDTLLTLLDIAGRSRQSGNATRNAHGDSTAPQHADTEARPSSSQPEDSAENNQGGMGARRGGQSEKDQAAYNKHATPRWWRVLSCVRAS